MPEEQQVTNGVDTAPFPLEDELPDGQEIIQLTGKLAKHSFVLDTEKMTGAWAERFDTMETRHGAVCEVVASTTFKYALNPDTMKSEWPLKKLRAITDKIVENLTGPKDET